MRAILEEHTTFVRINQCEVQRTFSTQPKMLDGMGIRRPLIRVVSLVKTEQLPLRVVQGDFTGGICA